MSAPAVLDQSSFTVDGWGGAFFSTSASFDASGYDDIDVWVYNSALTSGYLEAFLQSLGPDGTWYTIGSILLSQYHSENSLYCSWPFGYGPSNTLRVAVSNAGAYGLGGVTAFAPNPLTFEYFVSGASAGVEGTMSAPTLLGSGTVHATSAGDTKATPFATAGFDHLMLMAIPSVGRAAEVHCIEQYPDGSWKDTRELFVTLDVPALAGVSPNRGEFSMFSSAMRAMTWSSSVYPLDFTWWVFGQPMGLY
jgi:hypothetical protein